MFNIAICDDEKYVIQAIKDILLDYQKANHTEFSIFCYSSGEAFLFEEEVLFDLIFMDIELGTANGIDVIKQLRIKRNNYHSQVVYVSGKDKYYRQVLDTVPLGFIDKPVNREQVEHYLQVSFNQLQFLKTIYNYKKRNELIRVPVERILYFEGDKRKIIIHTVNGTDEFYGKIKNVFSDLTKHNFVMTHNSFIVNNIYVSKVSSDSVELINGERIPMSKSFMSDVMRAQVETVLE